MHKQDTSIMVVDEANFATVLNQYSEVEIGDSIYIVKPNFVYSIFKNNQSALSALRENRISESSRLSRFKILKQEFTENNKSLETEPRSAIPNTFSWTGDQNRYSNEYKINSKRYERVQIQAFCNNYGVYSVLGFKIKGRARQGGLFNIGINNWFDDELDYAKMENGYAEWQQPNTGDVFLTLLNMNRNFGH